MKWFRHLIRTPPLTGFQGNIQLEGDLEEEPEQDGGITHFGKPQDSPGRAGGYKYPWATLLPLHAGPLKRNGTNKWLVLRL